MNSNPFDSVVVNNLFDPVLGNRNGEIISVVGMYNGHFTDKATNVLLHATVVTLLKTYSC